MALSRLDCKVFILESVLSGHMQLLPETQKVNKNQYPWPGPAPQVVCACVCAQKCVCVCVCLCVEVCVWCTHALCTCMYVMVCYPMTIMLVNFFIILETSHKYRSRTFANFQITK